MEYAKILVGKHQGKTLFITSNLNDSEGRILIEIDGMHWEFQQGEYELIDMYGRRNREMSRDNIMKDLKTVVRHNVIEVEKVGGDQNLAKNIISFYHNGISVYNPLFDESGRFEVNPFDYYGKGKISNMIERFKMRGENEMKTVYLVEVYEYDNFITLDSNHFEKISGNKCFSTKRMVLLSEQSYNYLIRCSNNDFDYDYYLDLCDKCYDDEATSYFLENRKDIELDLDDYILQNNMSDLAELIEYDFDGNVNIIRKQPKKVTKTFWE